MRVRETVRRAAGTSGRAYLQLLGFAVNVGVEWAGQPHACASQQPGTSVIWLQSYERPR